MKTLHRAITTGAVEWHILAPHVSSKDMGVLKKRLEGGTLMRSLTAVADAPTKAAAVQNMPNDVGRIFAKVPTTTVKELGTHLNTLDRGPKGTVICDC